MRGKRVLLLAATTGYQTRVFAAEAGRLGLALTLGTDHCDRLDDPWGDQAVAVRFDDPERSLRGLTGLGATTFDGIVAVGDQPAALAAHVAKELGLRFHPLEALQRCNSKFEMRNRFRSAGLLVPDYRLLPLREGPDEAACAVKYPCVLKPLGLSASRGVIRANDPREFRTAFERITAILAGADIHRSREAANRLEEHIQVENFIPGREFALEGLVTGGRLQTLALFDKPDRLDGPFFEETIYTTPSRESAVIQEGIAATAQEAVTALGLAHGPVHAEMRVNPAGVWMLEVAGRPIGGLCAKVLRFSGGTEAAASLLREEAERPSPRLATLEEVILRHALGEDVSAIRREDSAAGVMMIPIPREGIYCGVRGEEAARDIPGIEEIEITAKEGYKLVPLPEGSTYLGFIFARGPSPERVESALRQAHERLEFEILSTLPVIGKAW